MIEPQRDIVSWSDLDDLVVALAGKVGADYDVMLVISRGGLVPAGMLAYRLGIRDVLVTSVVAYDDAGSMGVPQVLTFPEDDALRGRRVLIMDEVWDTGLTISAVTERVRAAGGEPTIAVLHYKPTRSRVSGTPDHFAHETAAWVVYPYKAGH